MPKKILFLSKNIHGAAARYRATQFFALFEAAGWQISHLKAETSPRAWLQLLHAASQADVVVVLRKTFNWFLLASLRRVCKKLIFDFDDAIFCRDNGSASNLRQRRFLCIIKTCDQIWAGNRYLAEHALALNMHTTVLPTSIDPELYSTKVTKPKDMFDLVWIGSSATKKYLVEALPMLEELGKKIPGLRLKVIADFDLEAKYITVVPICWNALSERNEIASAHIGIAPMYDDAWTQGKCALKVLQYMAAELPVVSSPVGANRDIVIPNVTGFLPQNNSEWLQAIQLLKDDPALRERMGRAGRERARENFSVAATFHKMLQLV